MAELILNNQPCQGLLLPLTHMVDSQVYPVYNNLLMANPLKISVLLVCLVKTLEDLLML